MNFSPAWIVALLGQRDSLPMREISIGHLSVLLALVGMGLSDGDVLMLYDYFDLGKCGNVAIQQFVDLLLPINNEALRNAVIKRVAIDL
jgi:hypothetical protein